MRGILLHATKGLHFVLFCREGDELHLVHVIPRLQTAAVYGAPPVDFLPQQDPVAYDQLVKNAESFIAGRFLPALASLRLQPIVHIVKVEACSHDAPSFEQSRILVLQSVCTDDDEYGCACSRRWTQRALEMLSAKKQRIWMWLPSLYLSIPSHGCRNSSSAASPVIARRSQACCLAFQSVPPRSPVR